MPVSNMKVLHLNLWLGDVCTDDDANGDNTNDDANEARRTKHDCIGSLVDKPNEPKSTPKSG